MNKFSVLLFSIGLLFLSFYGLYSNSYYVQVFINLDMPYIYARLGLIAILLAYTFVPSLRLYITRALLGIAGISFLALGLISFGSPTILGYSNNYILIGDALTLIEAGILSLILSADLSVRRSKFVAKSFVYVRSPFVSHSSKLIYTPPLSPTKVL